ncbi:hypothetical protein [Candidatus Cardinium hertigii]|uniref:hypothetical protein n=1 Tax=Candidatus Cardinium hertigii TaxID=247481 RepID=UPI003D7DD73B
MRKQWFGLLLNKCGNSVDFLKAMIASSSALVNALDLRSLGPIGKWAFYFTPFNYCVLGLRLNSLAVFFMPSLYKRIALYRRSTL